jgi:hypothetical protein
VVSAGAGDLPCQHVDDGVGPRPEAQLGQDPLDLEAHDLLGLVQPQADLGIRQAVGYQPEQPLLPLRQAREEALTLRVAQARSSRLADGKERLLRPGEPGYTRGGHGANDQQCEEGGGHALHGGTSFRTGASGRAHRIPDLNSQSRNAVNTATEQV